MLWSYRECRARGTARGAIAGASRVDRWCTQVSGRTTAVVHDTSARTVVSGLVRVDACVRILGVAGVLLFSRLLTNTAINEADPVVMSNFSLVMITVWGLAYMGAASSGANVRWLAAAFAVEKLVYVVVWVMWHSKNSVGRLVTTDLFAGVCFSIYGLNDLVFMVFFSWVCYALSRHGITEDSVR